MGWREDPENSCR